MRERMPPQVPPVKRPHFIQPHEAVDVEHGDGEDLVSIRIALQHGANWNDPAYFQMPPYAQTKNT